MAATAEPAPGATPQTSTRTIVVADHYEIDPDQPIGSGGMSIVYEGRDLKNRRTVAMRTLRPEQAQNPEIRARFRKEARTMAFIQHPNVARVYDLWEDDTSAWVAMELVPGESLKEVLAEAGTLPVYDVEPILSQSASALDALHRAGMVHLDVKPSNLIQTPDGTIKLIDFGLAQESDQTQELLHGMAYGSAAYLSPEQASGEPVGPPSDVYSLGCVVYELLTGRTPFEDPYRTRSSQEMLQAHLALQPERPSEANPGATIPDWCDELVIWSLIKDPDTRLQSPGRFAHLFEEGIAGDLTATDVRRMRASLAKSATAPGKTTATVAAPIAVTSSRIDAQAAVSSGQPSAKPFVLRVLGPVRPLLWRLVMALLVVNLLLAAVLYVQRGEVPGLIDSASSSLAPGNEIAVAVDGLNLRDAAGMDAPSIATLAAGTQVYLRGEPVMVDGDRWWPVTVGNPADGLDGWVWEQGLEQGSSTIRQRIDDAIVRLKEMLGG